MKLIQQLKVAIKTLVVMTGFCAMMLGWPGEAKAQYPLASFTSNVFTGCAPLSVNFVNMSTQATNYYWDFGNGNTSTLTDPTTVYLTSGFYTVRLIAMNSLTGNRDTLIATNYINVVSNPTANFTASSTTGCIGSNSISFNNFSINATNYIWDFGDGTFSTQANPTHTYTSTGVYTVKLIARNSFNCTNIYIEPAYITILPNPAASFTVNQQSSCNVNQVFNFNCTTTGSIGWQWSFGDGNTSTLQNPSHVYGAQGSYNVTLIVTNPGGCSDTISQPAYINIGASLVPFFTVNSQTGCPPFNAIFNCNVPNATSWSWDFGDGVTSTLQNPSHLYINPGSYDITLTVITSSGCNGTVTLPGYIVVDQIPVPSFTVNTPTGCDPHQTAFNNTSSNGTTYLWNFGNGNTSTGFNPTNLYITPGTYNVTLTTISTNGCSQSITQNAAVTVNTVSGTVNGTPRSGCSPLSVAFVGSSTVASSTFQWNFGNGNTATGQNATNIYAATGNYSVTLIITSPAGCKDTIIRTNYIRIHPDSIPYTVPDTILVCTPPGSVSFTDPTPSSNQWLWNFGNGVTSTVKNPSYAYTVPGIYTVTLTTGMNGGCTQTFNPYAVINVIPLIISPITHVLVTPCGPYTINFDNGTLNIASYLWDFGDGTTSTLQSPVHTYNIPGTYTITLLMISVSGCQTSVSTTITVGHQNPITISDDRICTGDAVNFGLNPVSSYVSAIWNFGDGNTSNLLQPSHTYTTTGSYNVSVTVTDVLGCVIVFNAPLPIIVSNPVSSFSVNQPTKGCIPFNVQFTNNSVGATGYYWYFGDGTNSSAANPSHVYSVADTFTVTLNASANGCMRSTTQTNLITTYEAIADFSFTPASGCLPLTASFSDLSVNAVSWLWNFGDGNTSTLQNPVHTYIAAPTGPISLTIVDINGCTKTRTKANVVPIAPDITASDSSGCKPLMINFSTTLSATSYLWDFGDGSTSTLQNPIHTYTLGGLYTVSLTCVLASGCTTTTVKPDFIDVASPVTDFMSPTLAVCAPTLVNFVNQTTGAITYLWDFGDGTTSTNSDPSHIYNIPGTYTVTLISTSASGCNDTLTKVDYIVVPGTFSDFTITSQTACLQTFAQFVDQSINATSWFWNFGDGFTSTLQNPSHTYADTGSYSVTLITTDSVGCSSFFSSPNPIIVYPNPVASGSVVTNAGCSPFVTAFLNSSTGGTNYVWHFGNGDSSTNANPVYNYPLPGSFQASLVAITAFGCTDTFTLPTNITVHATPVAAFLPDVNSGCEPLNVNFTNQSAPLSNPVYLWNFGNGQTSSLQDPSVIFASAGIYPVQLVVVNTGGCNDTVTQSITVLPSPVAIASVSSYVGCSPLPVTFTNTSTGSNTYLWNFGDGSTSTAANPNHTFSTSGNYQVTLIATGSNGCSDTLILPTSIVVNQTPLANFSRTPVSGCEPVTVTIADLSSQLNNPVYSWDFGNGTTGNTQINPPVVYTAAGVYSITLIVTNTGGCADTITKNVTVHPRPVADATASSNIGCAPFAVTFTNNTTGATSYLWNFGDGTTSSLLSPVHNYTTAGVYNVTLIATSGNGCVDTLILSSPITVNISPNANFSRTPLSGCSPLDVTFNNTSTQLSNPTYLWDFGNGLTSTSAINPPVLYNSPGFYSILMVVTNDNGCIDSVRKGITVYETPIATAAMSDSVGCAPFGVTFTNNTSGTNTYVWNFGDGTTSTAISPSHTFASAGTYIVSLVATTANGCADTLIFSTPIQVNTTPVANFSRTPGSGCIPVVVSFNNMSTSLVNPVYNWNFGNGQTSTLEDPVITFATSGVFPVTLIVTNDSGCSDTIVRMVTANNVPIANATPSDTSGCSPLAVTFTNTSTNAVSYLWNFGDGSTSATASPSHNYTVAGNYTVTLIATSASGCTDTLQFPFTFDVLQSPTANFTRTPASGCTSLDVFFNSTSTQLSNPAYSWDFGNGQIGNQPSANITYNTAGTFPVTLTVTNNNGCSDDITKNIITNQTPDAIATVSGTNGCAPYYVSFTNNSIAATSYVWSFGDGSTSTLQTPVHTYTSPGNYAVTLVAIGTGGCSDTLVFTPVIRVKPTPSAAFNSSVVNGCAPLSVAFTDISTGLDSPVYSWNMGNGQTSNSQNTSALYATAGTYIVTQIVTNTEGCSDTATSTITINPLPVADASVQNQVGCSPLIVTFQNSSTGATGYLWNFGDGATSTNATPSHTYTAAGSFTVSLVASNQFGCTDTFVFSSPVVVNQTPVAAFTPSAIGGCTPLNVNFVNQSSLLVSPVYSWNLGNGQTGATAGINGAYTTGGVYPVSMIVTNQGGCSDTALSTITVYDDPMASASTSDTVGCTPHTVNFTNNTINGVSYLWNFGDGTTSTQQTPSHIYNTAGNYTVTLIVGGAGACGDTLVLPYIIHVKATPNASFGPASVTGCTPLNVVFNNTSTGLVGAGYSWTFGNGITSTVKDPAVTYLQGGIFNVMLVVTNNEGCTDTATSAVTANLTPVAQASAIDTIGCAPHQVIFNSSSLFATSILWNLGDGTTSTLQNVPHTYSVPGTYIPYLVAYSAAGCSDTAFFAAPVQVNPVPVAAFTVNQTASCSGTTFQFQSLSTPTTGLNYNWNIGGTIYTVQNPSVPIMNPGFYNVSLVVTNQFGCSDTVDEPNYIQVFDTIPPPTTPILSVSVLSNTSVEITWQNSSVLDLGAYVLYRKNLASGIYDEIYRDNTPDNSSMSVTSAYVDNGLNTLQNVYTYKLLAVDKCAFSLPLTALNPHTTINVTATPVNDKVNVVWTRYLGCSVSSYEVNRVNLSDGTSSLIATVPPNTLTYLDQNFYCPDEYSYRITATSLCGNIYTSLSDTSIAKPANPLAAQKVEIVRTTVIDDRNVLSEWLPPTLAPNRVAQYNVMKSTDNINYSEIATLPANALSYIDYDTDVHNQDYFYRIDVVSDCELAGTPSNNGASILLKSDWEREKTKLWWTPYTDWNTGVDFYIIEQENPFGQWLPVKTVGGNELNTILDE